MLTTVIPDTPTVDLNSFKQFVSPATWEAESGLLSKIHLMECFGCLVPEVLSETLSPMHQREPVNIGLEYWNTGLEYWNTGLEYWNTGLEYWNTGLEYWNTGLEYWTGILDWNTGILDWITGILHGLEYWTGLTLHTISGSCSGFSLSDTSVIPRLSPHTRTTNSKEGESLVPFHT